MKTKTSLARNSMNRSPVRCGLLLISLVLTYLALSPEARAVCQQGCLTNDNTVLGDDALLSNTGIDNTAIGSNALKTNMTGNFNTAIGDFALLNNTTGSSNTAIGEVALARNTTGSFNIALGKNAGSRITTGSKNIDIGNPGMDGDDNKIRIGTTGTHMA